MHWTKTERTGIHCPVLLQTAKRLIPLGFLIQVELAQAHVFGSTYTPPVPVIYYQAGAALALLISFLVVVWVLRSPALARLSTEREMRVLRDSRWLPGVRWVLQSLGLALLALAIGGGLLGHQNPYLNFSMTGFWVVFVLGFYYAHVLFGNLLDPLNPWRTLCLGAARLAPALFAGCLRNPARWGYLPALLLYMAFIWFELYGAGAPRATAQLLLAYVFINLVGSALWGTRHWLRYGEFFSVLFHLVSHLAPVHCQGGKLLLRLPMAGLLRARTDGTSQLVFILFMLASTAFDGLQSMVAWLEMSWSFLRNALAGAIAANPAQAVSLLQGAFKVYHGVGLVLAPFWYLLLYEASLLLARWISLSRHSIRDWLLAFGMSLVPIAVVYHAAHYFTLLQVQGLKVIPLLSDPLGRGWDLFGTLHWFARPLYPDAATVWNVQVALILLGHLIGVLLAHFAALQLMPRETGRRRLIASQLPLLVLMMGLTVFGLWILAQPAAAGR